MEARRGEVQIEVGKGETEGPTASNWRRSASGRVLTSEYSIGGCASSAPGTHAGAGTACSDWFLS